MLVIGLGPQTSPANEIVIHVVNFIWMVVTAIILLPALRRLQPRRATPAPAAPPPP
jgi:hypothetical protein